MAEKTKEELQAELAEANAKAAAAEKAKAKLEKQVEGFKESGAKDLTVKGTAKVDGKKYGFKQGYLKTWKNGVLIDSTEALKDEELMAHLVKIGYAGIEEKK